MTGAVKSHPSILGAQVFCANGDVVLQDKMVAFGTRTTTIEGVASLILPPPNVNGIPAANAAAVTERTVHQQLLIAANLHSWSVAVVPIATGAGTGVGGETCFVFKSDVIGWARSALALDTGRYGRIADEDNPMGRFARTLFGWRVAFVLGFPVDFPALPTLLLFVIGRFAGENHFIFFFFFFFFLFFDLEPEFDGSEEDWSGRQLFLYTGDIFFLFFDFEPEFDGSEEDWSGRRSFLFTGECDIERVTQHCWQ